MSDLRGELQAIYEKYGKLTPAIVVNEARDPDSALHHRLPWDDKEAAEWAREQIAANLIRSVKIRYREATDTTEAGQIRAFLAVPDPDGGQTYVPAETVRQDDFTRQLVIRQAERDAIAFKRKYEHLAEYLDIVTRHLAS